MVFYKEIETADKQKSGQADNKTNVRQDDFAIRLTDNRTHQTDKWRDSQSQTGNRRKRQLRKRCERRLAAVVPEATSFYTVGVLCQH